VSRGAGTLEPGSDKHGPRVDEELEHETQSLQQGASVERRVEEHREQKAPGEGQPTTDARLSGGRARAASLDLDDAEARAKIARFLTPSAFPAYREALLAEAEGNQAPEVVLERLQALPEGRTYENVQDLLGALGPGSSTGSDPAATVWGRAEIQGAGGGFELLEHTADVGIRAWGASLEEVFERATLGLAEVLGASRPGAGEPVAVEVSAADAGGLLVDWLNEVLWLREVRGVTLAGVRVERVGKGRASGMVAFASGGPPPDGTFVKAVTYHRLRVERVGDQPGEARHPGAWLAEVYLDV
jgi:SHS2 domain-containing protein